ncbi:hypothetical protein PMAYCL1PPCAC_01622 [Pristionchus mayeri]|uniref:C2H2-type domain-containing protein n=1 Tax=Pristionchus mayeri TaxID=1317129 RepID=A0AAN5C672_9BILA|nr:hypothetical protein PMAYCL1PPCAC_01622 [Pristionchus mayeri]
MAEQLKAFRLASLEEWRTRAFGLGGPLGHLFTRTFEVIHTVVRDGVDNEMSLPYALESLGRERDHAMSRDDFRDEPVRQLVYGLSDAIKTMVDSIREEKSGGGVADGGGGGGLIPLRAASSVPQFVIARGPVGGARSRSVAAAAGVSAAVAAGIVAASPPQEEEEAAQEEWNSSSSDSNALPLFTGNIKREQQEPAPSEHAPSTFDLDDFEGTGARRPAYQAVNTLNIKRALSEEPTPSTPIPSKKAFVAAHAATDPRKGPVTLHGCDICDRFFESEKGMLRHLFTHKAAQCLACRKYVSKEKLKKHMKEKHGGSRRRGSKAKAGWIMDADSDMSDIEEAPRVPSRHDRAATVACLDDSDPVTPPNSVGGRFPCDKCDKSFTSIVGLHRHEYVHDAIACPICSRPLSKMGLDKHIREHHRAEYRDIQNIEDRLN